MQMRYTAQVRSALCLFFFFQAEDGIRDLTVTGVQTCALPIFCAPALLQSDARALTKGQVLSAPRRCLGCEARYRDSRAVSHRSRSRGHPSEDRKSVV